MRDRLIANNAADRWYAAMAGMEPQVQAVIAPKRERAAPDPEDSEAPVLRAVGELLAAHPKVHFAVRQNTGALPYQNAAGKVIPVWFYRLVRKPDEMTLTDYWGFLTDNRPFAFECKRPSWKHPRTDREMRQWAFIDMITKHGGMGSFVRSVDEVIALLPA